MSKISAVVTVFNEEKKIAECLSKLKFADEIVVVDDESTDNTVAIAKKYTSKIFTHKNKGYVEPARNFAISKATGDWILIVDADEEIPEALIERLRQISEESSFDYVRIARRNIIFGKWIKSDMWWPDYNIRFFKKGKVNWSDEIHSKPEVVGNGLDLEPDEDLSIKHLNYESVSQYIQKMDKYTDAEAKKILTKHDFKFTDAIRFPVDDFVKTFFFQKGYKDGLHGLVLSILQAFYMEIVFAKVWEAHKFKQIDDSKFLEETNSELINSENKIKYWIKSAMIEESKSQFKKAILKASRRITSSKIKD